MPAPAQLGGSVLYGVCAFAISCPDLEGEELVVLKKPMTGGFSWSRGERNGIPSS